MIDKLITLAFYWHLLGWFNVAFFCRFKLQYLNLCQFLGFLILLPIGELFIFTICAILWELIYPDPIMALGYFITGISGSCGLIFLMAVLMKIEEALGMSNICKILWRKV